MEWLLSNWYVFIGLFITLIGILSFSDWGIVLLTYGMGIMFFKLNILAGSIIVCTMSFGLLILINLNFKRE